MHVGLDVRPVLLLGEHVFRQLGNLQEGFRGHVLNARVLFVHELVQLLDHRLQERPVTHEEVREAADDVHDVRRHQGLVVLALLFLAQVQQFLHHLHDEVVFLFGFHSSTDRAKSPAELLKAVKTEVVLVTRDFLEAALDSPVHTLSVDVGHEDECLSHLLVEIETLDIDALLLDSISIFIDHD